MENELQKVEKTYTVQELIHVLKDYPKDYRVYLSIDSEGNGYGTVTDQSVGYVKQDKVLILSPWNEGLTYEDIMPNFNDEILAEHLED